MPNWIVRNIKLRLEYAVQAVEGFDLLFEEAVEYPLAPKVFITDQPAGVPGDVILALQRVDDHAYELFRLKDSIRFGFDAEAEAKPVQGALKVGFTIADQDTGAAVVDTACYPIRSDHDRQVQTIPDLADSKEEVLLLMREAVSADPPTVVYRLAYFEPPGAESADPWRKRLLLIDSVRKGAVPWPPAPPPPAPPPPPPPGGQRPGMIWQECGQTTNSAVRYMCAVKGMYSAGPQR
jgi:hypothetical protein